MLDQTGSTCADAFLCPRCKATMSEVARIAPLGAAPGLIAYECPRCRTRAACDRGWAPQLGPSRALDEGGRRAATIYSLIATAKLNDVDPQAWLADVLARLPDQSCQAYSRTAALELAPAAQRRCSSAERARRLVQDRPTPWPSPDAYRVRGSLSGEGAPHASRIQFSDRHWEPRMDG